MISIASVTIDQDGRGRGLYEPGDLIATLAAQDRIRVDQPRPLECQLSRSASA
jgi:hypothetical protein